MWALTLELFKSKRASRSIAKTGFSGGSKSMAGAMFQRHLGEKGVSGSGFGSGLVSGCLLGCFLNVFGDFVGAFWEPLGTPLGDFWWTFAALGIAFETFVGLWAFLLAFGRICEVSVEFLSIFLEFLVKFSAFSVISCFIAASAPKW